MSAAADSDPSSPAVFPFAPGGSAETVGSIAATMEVDDDEKQREVGGEDEEGDERAERLREVCFRPILVPDTGR